MCLNHCINSFRKKVLIITVHSTYTQAVVSNVIIHITCIIISSSQVDGVVIQVISFTGLAQQETRVQFSSQQPGLATYSWSLPVSPQQSVSTKGYGMVTVNKEHRSFLCVIKQLLSFNHSTQMRYRQLFMHSLCIDKFLYIFNFSDKSLFVADCFKPCTRFSLTCINGGLNQSCTIPQFRKFSD